MKEIVVVSVGGSILIPGEEDEVYIGKLASMLRRVSEKVNVAVVCGGGRIARYYTSTGRALGGSEDQLDTMGIGATRLNASLLAVALGDMSSLDIPVEADAAAGMIRDGYVPVMGGTAPGHTTDAVATMVARDAKAVRVVNATSVDAVYSDDPRENPDAVRYDRLTIDQLDELVYKDHGAGKSSVFDPMGVDIARDEGIDIMMVDGRNLPELEKAILGESFSGTYVSSRRSVPDPSCRGVPILSIRRSLSTWSPVPPSWISYGGIRDVFRSPP